MTVTLFVKKRGTVDWTEAQKDHRASPVVCAPESVNSEGSTFQHFQATVTKRTEATTYTDHDPMDSPRETHSARRQSINYLAPRDGPSVCAQ